MFSLLITAIFPWRHIIGNYSIQYGFVGELSLAIHAPKKCLSKRCFAGSAFAADEQYIVLDVEGQGRNRNAAIEEQIQLAIQFLILVRLLLKGFLQLRRENLIKFKMTPSERIIIPHG